MSLRDLYCFLAGVVVTAIALGVHSIPAAPGNAAQLAAAVLSAPASELNDSDLLAAQKISLADPATSAGSLDEVTAKLAARLTFKGGSEAEWRLLAQSFDYMGRTQEARQARSHLTESGHPANSHDRGS